MKTWSISFIVELSGDFWVHFFWLFLKKGVNDLQCCSKANRANLSSLELVKPIQNFPVLLEREEVCSNSTTLIPSHCGVQSPTAFYNFFELAVKLVEFVFED